jgi:hypothetical protein
MASAYDQELVPLLAKPLVVALQHTQQAVADAVMDVLEEHAALDQADLLADALLLLAYQVTRGRLLFQCAIELHTTAGVH